MKAPKKRKRGTPHVCMLVRNDVYSDSRVQKEADSLANAGFKVTVVGLDYSSFPFS